MKLIKNNIFRLLLAIAAAILLLSPTFLMAIVWTGLNFEVALVAVLIVVAVARFAPKWRWGCSVIASLLIAVPPYPYWVYHDKNRGWYLHFFDGYSMKDVPIITFAVYFLIAMLLFGVIFWAITPRKA